jgi:hypothetical protein
MQPPLQPLTGHPPLCPALPCPAAKPGAKRPPPKAGPGPNPLPSPKPGPTPSPGPNPLPSPKPGPSPMPLPSPKPGTSPSPSPLPSPKPGPSPSPGMSPRPSPRPVPVPSPSPDMGGQEAPPPDDNGGGDGGDGGGGNLPNSCFKKSNAYPIEMCDGTVCNGADNEFDTFQQCCQTGWNRPATDTIRGDGINNFECYVAANATIPGEDNSTQVPAFNGTCYKTSNTWPIEMCDTVTCNGAGNEYQNFTSCCQVGFNRTATDTIRGDGESNFECYVVPGVNLTFDGNTTNRATTCFKSSNTYPVQMCDREVCNGNGEFTDFGTCCSSSFNRSSDDPLMGDGIDNFNCYVAPGVMQNYTNNGSLISTTCYKASNSWPVQLCDQFVCNGPDNGYPTFSECCQKSWNKTETDAIRGDGMNNTECYLAPQVYDPPCYVPFQNLGRKQCVLTADRHKCYTGECAPLLVVRLQYPCPPGHPRSCAAAGLWLAVLACMDAVTCVLLASTGTSRSHHCHGMPPASQQLCTQPSLCMISHRVLQALHPCACPSTAPPPSQLHHLTPPHLPHLTPPHLPLPHQAAPTPPWRPAAWTCSAACATAPA